MTKANVTTTCIEVSFAANALRNDIFSRVCAYMEVPRDYNKLGWRLSTARRSDPPHCLITSEDVDAAFMAAKNAQGAGRKKQKVIIEVLNMVSQELLVMLETQFNNKFT
jgi:hypothetical protein